MCSHFFCCIYILSTSDVVCGLSQFPIYAGIQVSHNLSIIVIFFFTPSHLGGVSVYTKPFQSKELPCNIRTRKQGLKCLLPMQLSKNTWRPINVPPFRVLEGGSQTRDQILYALRASGKQFADNRTSWSCSSAPTGFKTGPIAETFL